MIKRKAVINQMPRTAFDFKFEQDSAIRMDPEDVVTDY